MKRQIITTSDGSKTIQIDDWNERYHSNHGAIQESDYVYIKQGLEHYRLNHPQMKPIKILEMGFGTGLNVLLSYQYALAHEVYIDLTTIEAYPISEEEIQLLNYPETLGVDPATFFELHKVAWEQPHYVHPNFSFLKHKLLFEEVDYHEQFDLIYFDAFGSRVQPELWDKSIFDRMYRALKPEGVLVTYAAIGQVRRDMQDLGFSVERLKGPPGKRHMMRATKTAFTI